jgi:hypothetical protein
MHREMKIEGYFLKFKATSVSFFFAKLCFQHNLLHSLFKTTNFTILLLKLYKTTKSFQQINLPPTNKQKMQDSLNDSLKAFHNSFISFRVFRIVLLFSYILNSWFIYVEHHYVTLNTKTKVVPINKNNDRLFLTNHLKSTLQLNNKPTLFRCKYS